MASGGEDQEWQRIDKWLWCARFMKARSDCARLIAAGSVRINRQVTDKPHARLRVGDVLTLPLRHQVIVIEVIALAERRGPASEARGLYRDMTEPTAASRGCKPLQSAPYADADEA